MATAIRKKVSAKNKNKLTYSLLIQHSKNIFLSSQGLPIFLMLALIAILFVLFRMKGIELNYNITAKSKEIEKVLIENKEFKAKKAKLLSVKNLNAIAKKYKLSQPKEKQIIVIP